MRHPARLLAVLAVAVTTAAQAVAPAHAAQRTGTPATVVDTTGLNGAGLRISAQDTTGTGLCLDVSYAGVDTADAACPRPPRTTAGDLAPRVLVQGAETVYYGAVTAGTRQVRIGVSTGRTVVATTYAGKAYAGRYAGDVRFYAVAVAGAPAVGGVTTRDAAAKGRAARDFDVLALPPLGRSWVARSTTDELDRPSELLVLGARIASPARHRPARRRSALCAGLRTAGSPSRSVCVSSTSRLAVRYASNCDTARTLLYGVAPASVRSATAVLPGGTRTALEVLRVPAGVKRKGVALFGELTAVPRQVLVTDAGGHRVASTTLSSSAC
jgi:hypothetical protein